MQTSSYNRGYTLIEVLVAFVILSLALTVLLRIFSGGLRSVSVSSDYAQATLIAESGLAATGLGNELSAGVTRGEVDQRFQWTRTVTEYSPFPGFSVSANEVPAYYVSVTVEWPHGAGKRSIHLATVRLLRLEGRGS